MFKFLNELFQFSSIDLLDILLVWVVLYYILSSVWKTSALPVLFGVLIITGVTVLSTYLGLKTFSFFLSQISNILLIIIVILFPGEVRRGLYRVGQLIPKFKQKDIGEDVIDVVVTSMYDLAKEKIGALVIIKNEDEMLDLIASGKRIDGLVSEQLLYAIFQKNSPLHDGVVVIDGNQIVSAGCYIPTLANRSKLDSKFGTRHRAALGFSERSDGIIIVVSEERGEVSLVHDDKLYENLDRIKLKSYIKAILKQGEVIDEEAKID